MDAPTMPENSTTLTDATRACSSDQASLSRATVDQCTALQIVAEATLESIAALVHVNVNNIHIRVRCTPTPPPRSGKPDLALASAVVCPDAAERSLGSFWASSSPGRCPLACLVGKLKGYPVPNKAKAFFKQNFSSLSENPTRPNIRAISRNLKSSLTRES